MISYSSVRTIDRSAVDYCLFFLMLNVGSMFFRAEFFSIPIGGFGAKLFHIIPLLSICVYLYSYRFKIHRGKLPISVVVLVFLFFCISLFQIVFSGITPGYVRALSLVLIFLASYLFHYAALYHCRIVGLDFNQEYLGLMSKVALFFCLLVILKNIAYSPDLASQFLGGEMRAKTDWNFMNFGQSINNEVVFYLMFLPFLRVDSLILRIVIYGHGALICIATSVDAAYLFLVYWFLVFSYSRFLGNGISPWILLMGYFILPVIVIGYFLNGEMDGLTGGELGRYILWNYGLGSLSDLTINELLFGGGDLAFMIEGYDDMQSIGHGVMDFHNLYFNLIFEYGAVFLVLYILLLLIPLIWCISKVDQAHPVMVFVGFTILSSWFTPRGFDYLYWFFIPAALLLAKGVEVDRNA